MSFNACTECYYKKRLLAIKGFDKSILRTLSPFDYLAMSFLFTHSYKLMQSPVWPVTDKKQEGKTKQTCC